MYTGPEFYIDYRYSQILTIIYICLMFSSGMPILYLVTFVHLSVMFWIDKIYLLRVCRTPKNYDRYMAEKVRQVLFYAPIVHILFAVALFGNN